MRVSSMLLLMMTLAASVLVARQEKDAPGKTIFIDKKCVSCHSIEAAGIVKKNPSSTKQGPPDLSNVGSMVAPGFIARFVMRDDTLHGKKHLIKFNGSSDELKVLSEWLEGLKSPADTSKK